MSDEWQYTVRVGYADEGPAWVAKVTDDLGEELLAVVRPTLNEALGAAATAIMDVTAGDDDVG